MFAPGNPPPNTVLVFYKVSCPTCKLTLPFLHRIQRNVLGISQDDAEATHRFEQQFDVRIPSILDDPAANYPLSNAFKIDYVPTMFVIDENGKVAERIDGFHKQALEALGVSFHESELVPVYKPG